MKRLNVTKVLRNVTKCYESFTKCYESVTKNARTSNMCVRTWVSWKLEAAK